MHNVVSVDVSLDIEKRGNPTSKDDLVTTGALENEYDLSITNILQKAIDVKIKKEKNPEADPARLERTLLHHEVTHAGPSREASVLLRQYKQLVRDKGARQFLYEIKFIEKEKSSQQSMTDKSASPAPLGDAENTAMLL